MRFEGFKLSRFVMYNGWLIGFGMMLVFMIIRPLSAGKGFMFFEMFQIFFLSSYKLTCFSIFLCFLMQLAGYDCSRTKIKFIEVLEDKAVFQLLNGKIFEFKYSELFSLNLTNNAYKMFEFTFKNGDKKIISGSLKDKDHALRLIQQKIQETNQSSVL